MLLLRLFRVPYLLYTTKHYRFNVVFKRIYFYRYLISVCDVTSYSFRFLKFVYSCVVVTYSQEWIMLIE